MENTDSLTINDIELDRRVFKLKSTMCMMHITCYLYFIQQHQQIKVELSPSCCCLQSKASLVLLQNVLQ